MPLSRRAVLLGAAAVVSAAGDSAPGAADAAVRGRCLALGERAALGAYVDGMVADPARLAEFEAATGRRAAVASYFYGFGDEFPASIERHFADGGRRQLLLSWDMGPTRFTDWSSGRHDAYLHRIAGHARAFRHPVYVRPWPEMNGDWQTFQPTDSGHRPHGGTPAQFVAAWRHVVDTLRAAGAGNLRWVFNPTADVYPETTPVAAIWPGSRYVDVLGLDGYNWGSGGQFRWLEFEEIFAEQYRRLTALHRTAPVWICEYGCKEPAVDDGAPVDPRRSKAQWLQRMLASTAFPRITTLISFEEHKERDWRTTSTPAAVAVLRAAPTGGR